MAIPVDLYFIPISPYIPWPESSRYLYSEVSTTNNGVDFDNHPLCTLCHSDWGFHVLSSNKRIIAVKSCLDLYYHALIIGFFWFASFWESQKRLPYASYLLLCWGGWERGKLWKLLCLGDENEEPEEELYLGEMGSRIKLSLVNHQLLRTDAEFYIIIELPNTILSMLEIMCFLNNH